MTVPEEIHRKIETDPESHQRNEDLQMTLGEMTDVADMKLDLDKGEKVRAVALMLGMRFYCDTIIRDSAYLQLMIAREEKMKFSNDPDKDLWHLRPSNVSGVIGAALQFEQFLLGKNSVFSSVKLGDKELGGRMAQDKV